MHPGRLLALALPLLAACGVGTQPASPDATPDAASDAAAPYDGPPLGGARCAWPRCVLDRAAACTPSGACVLEDTGPAGSVCFANGVRFLERLDRAAATLVYRVTLPDGATTCYAAEGVLGPAGTVTYRDGAGRVFATGTVRDGVLSVTCEGAQPAVVGTDCLPVPRPVSPRCSAGACR